MSNAERVGPIHETEVVKTMAFRLKALKRENVMLERIIAHLDQHQLDYVKGYRDGLRDAIDVIHSRVTLSFLIGNFKNQVIDDIQQMMPPELPVPHITYQVKNEDPF